MSPDEIRDYHLLKKIQSLCDEAKEWSGSVTFEDVWQACSDEIRTLKSSIGDRVISEYLEDKEKE